jgi:tRNA/rRNA methyltransferase
MTIIEGVKIVLVEPAGERNIGSIARVMRNMGLSQLTIVNPRCDHLSEEAQIMAVHGVEVLKQAQIVATLPQALQGCHRAIATTARPRGIPTELETPRQAIPWLLDSNITSALVFGPEDRGLSNEELSYAQRFICIEANPEYPSLNLAQAVGICGYELYQHYCSLTSEKQEKSAMNEDIATIEQLEGYYQHLESVLLKINYIYPHTAANKMEKLRRIINRSNLNRQELALLRGILRQGEWGLEQK